jgi:large subunit ribosomal protein L9
MEVILLSKVSQLGFPGDIVQVKPGYARNYLIPRGLAETVNPQRKKYFAHQKMLSEKAKEKSLKEAEVISSKIKDFTLSISKKTSDSSKIYGKVTPQDIVNEFKKHGFEFQKKQIRIDDISTLGVYQGEIKIYGSIKSEFKVWVVSESEKKE